MIELRPVTRDTLRTLWELEVSPDQAAFVSPNLVTLAQGPYEGGAYPMGIWDGDTAVGFLSVIDMRETRYLEDGEDPNSAYLWRFMVARDQQRRGYGRAALDALCDWVRDRELPCMYTSAVERNAVAIALYESVGYVRTGRVVNGEVELRRDLA